MRTFIVIIITAVLVLVGRWAVLHYWMNTQVDVQEHPTMVRAEPAVRGDLYELVSAPGTVEPRTKVAISAKVTARIVELPYAEGMPVTRGRRFWWNLRLPASVLVRLDAKDLEAALKSVEARTAAQASQLRASEAHLASSAANITGLRVNLADAQRDLRRQKQLLASKDVSQSIVDQAQSKVDALQAQVDAAEHSLRADQESLVAMRHTLDASEADITKAKEDLANTIILSPIDGIVTVRKSKVGEMAVAGLMSTPGSVILEVADTSQMLFEARVDETVIAGVRQGQRAHVRIPAYEDEVFDGVVESVALSETEEERGSAKYFKTVIVLDTHGRRIYSGLTADADIETTHHVNMIKVPSQAVLGRPVDDLPEEIRLKSEVDRGKHLATVVYRLVDGKAVVTPIAMGPSDSTHTIARSGLAVGDKVITGPYKVLESLSHGKRVEEMKPATAPATTRAAATTNAAATTQAH